MNHKSFMRAICADPSDDTQRLVYADFLEDNGEAERAEFIRVQCELARLDLEFSRRGGTYPPSSHESDLRRRERELLNAHGLSEWVPDGWEGWVTGRNSFRRGFVAAINLSLADCLKHLPQLVKVAPLERVDITDLKPTTIIGETVSYFYTTPSNAPTWLINSANAPSDGKPITGHTTIAAAEARLSEVLLKYARLNRPSSIEVLTPILYDTI